MSNDKFRCFQPKTIDSIISSIIATIWNYIIFMVCFYHIMSEGTQNAMNDMIYFLIPYFICLCLHFYRIPRIMIVVLGGVGIFGFSIWIGLFFGCFYNNLKIEYSPAENCKIEFIYPIYDVYLKNEQYREIKVLFTSQNSQKQYVGKLCQSSSKYQDLGTFPYPYISPESGQDLEKMCTKRKIKGNNNSDCLQLGMKTYEYSQLKTPAWQCIPFDKDISKFYTTCYYAPIGDEKGISSDKDQNILQVPDFYRVILSKYPYYNKQVFDLIFGFCFFPFSFTTLWVSIPLGYKIRKYLFQKKQRPDSVKLPVKQSKLENKAFCEIQEQKKQNEVFDSVNKFDNIKQIPVKQQMISKSKQCYPVQIQIANSYYLTNKEYLEIDLLKRIPLSQQTYLASCQLTDYSIKKIIQNYIQKYQNLLYQIQYLKKIQQPFLFSQKISEDLLINLNQNPKSVQIMKISQEIQQKQDQIQINIQ